MKTFCNHSHISIKIMIQLLMIAATNQMSSWKAPCHLKQNRCLDLLIWVFFYIDSQDKTFPAKRKSRVYIGFDDRYPSICISVYSTYQYLHMHNDYQNVYRPLIYIKPVEIATIACSLFKLYNTKLWTKYTVTTLWPHTVYIKIYYSFIFTINYLHIRGPFTIMDKL